jgi:membrane-associated phospholipid phosphatase
MSTDPAPDRRGWLTRDRALEILGVAALLGLLALSTYNAVTTDRFPADLSITRWLQKLDLGPIRGLLFTMGLRGVAGVTLGLTALWLWFRGHRVEGVMCLLIVLPDISSFALRDLFDRPRPDSDLVVVYGGPQGASFPSGTALHTIFFFGFVLYLLPRIQLSSPWKRAVAAACVVYIPVMGLWVVHHGRHWPSDVLGGYVYGAVYLYLWIKLYQVARAWDERHPGVLASLTLRRLGSRLRLMKAP